jgi:hypothetical protein
MTKDGRTPSARIRDALSIFSSGDDQREGAAESPVEQPRSSISGVYTAEDYKLENFSQDVSHLVEDVQRSQEEIRGILVKDKWSIDDVEKVNDNLNKKLDIIEKLQRQAQDSAKKAEESAKKLEKGETSERGKTPVGQDPWKVDPWEAKPIWQPLERKAVPWERKGISFKDMLRTSRDFVPTYPGRIQEEFKPKNSYPEGVPQNGTILKLECEKDAASTIDNWAMDIRFHVLARGIETWTVERVLTFAEATLRGNAGRFWEVLKRNTDIRHTVITQVGAPDEVIPIMADFLKQEFVGYSLIDKNDELIEKARMAITKIQICDMCFFEEYLCEFQHWYYQMGPQDQAYAKDVFIQKLPGQWPDLVKQQIKQRLLRDPEVTDTLGVRAEAVRQMIRLYCMQRHILQDVRTMPYMNQACCPKTDGVAGRYGCDSTESRKPKREKKGCAGGICHPKQKTPKGRKPIWKGYGKRRSSRKGAKKPQKRFLRPNRAKDEAREGFKKKYGRYPKCPKGKNLSDCDCCWFCGKKGHKADECTEAEQRKGSLKRILMEDSEELLFEPIWTEEIDSDDDSLYSLFSIYSEESESEEEENEYDNQLHLKLSHLRLGMMKATEESTSDLVYLPDIGENIVGSADTEIPSEGRDCQEWKMPKAKWAEVYKASWMPYKETVKVIEKEITACVEDTDAGTFVIKMLTPQEVAKAGDKQARYAHFGLVQIGIDPLVRKGQDLPILIAVMDGSVGNLSRAMLGGARANLFSGATWIKVIPDLHIDLQDKSVVRTLEIRVNTREWQRKLLCRPDRRCIRVIARLYVKYYNTGRPTLRKGACRFTQLFQDTEGSSVKSIQPEVIDHSRLTWPKVWVTPKVEESQRSILPETVRQKDNKLVIQEPEEPEVLKNEVTQGELRSKGKEICSDEGTSESRSSTSRRVVGYRTIRIPEYEEEEPHIKYMGTSILSAKIEEWATSLNLEIGQQRYKALVDTGCTWSCTRIKAAGLIWESQASLKVTVGNSAQIYISEIARDVKMIINGKEFEEEILCYIPELPDDFLLGNMFLKRNYPVIMIQGGIILGNHYVPTAFYGPSRVNEVRSEESDSSIGTSSSYQEKLDSWINLLGGRILPIRDSRLEEIKSLLSENWSDNPQKLWKKSMPEAEIILKDPTTIIRSKGITYPKTMIEEFEKQIPELLDLGLIRHSKSQHRSAAFMVMNHAEQVRGKARMVIDYRTLNIATKDDGYNLPNQESLRNRIRSERPEVYSKFDLKSGYWQIKVKENAISLTAFSTPIGLYEWLVMPFGLKNAPGIFQRRMDRAFEGMTQYVAVYIDDVLVFSKNIEEHYKHLRQVAQVFIKEGMIFSERKTTWIKPQIEFLGLTIQGNEETLQPHIAEKLLQFPDELENRKQIQRFLGVLNYARRFIKDLAKIARPIQKKVSSKVTWNWSEEDTSTVKNLKGMIQKLPKLEYPDGTEERIILETDASNEAWGCVLKVRRTDKTEHLSRYWSGCFKNAELNYPVHEKELLAVLMGIRTNELFLGKEFTIRTDSSYVKQFMGISLKRCTQARLVRWRNELQYYSFDVEYIKGKTNTLADALTRYLSNCRSNKTDGGKS